MSVANKHSIQCTTVSNFKSLTNLRLGHTWDNIILNSTSNQPVTEVH